MANASRLELDQKGDGYDEDSSGDDPDPDADPVLVAVPAPGAMKYPADPFAFVLPNVPDVLVQVASSV